MKRYQQDQLGTLAPAIAHLQKATTRYWDGLFACYQVKDLPRTNNDLEDFFGAAHHAERHITGRKQASSTLVVRGSVRVVVIGASRILSISAADLLSDLPSVGIVLLIIFIPMSPEAPYKTQFVQQQSVE